jgi:hypothetical protein
MPRLSLYHPQKSNNYRYIDRIVKEQYEVGGTDLLIHKYVGTSTTAEGASATPSASAIQDLLFLETRDRTYDAHVYRLRGHYNVQNLDFDLSQFGLFLNNDTIFITVHFNDMIDIIGRKLMVGDVFELPHLTDYHPLDDSIPVGLRRYYQITDANYASEGFSQTWFAHLWRIKCEPLVNSQQFAEILNQPMNKDNYIGHYDPTKSYEPGYTVTSGGKVYTPIKDVPVGISPPDPEYWKVDENPTESSVVDTYQTNLDINDAVIAEALKNVPKSGYDISNLYVVPTFLDDQPAPPIIIDSPEGGPSLGQGSLIAYRSPRYTTAGYAIRVNHNAKYQLRPGMKIILGSGLVRTVFTDTNSGRVTPDLVLTATVGTTSNNGPYGTADNTYSTADQYPKFTVIVTATPSNGSVVKVTTWSNDLVAGLELNSTFYSVGTGTLNKVWPVGTTITAIDKANLSFTTSNPTIIAMAAGTGVDVAYNFNGNISSVMDYRADCDPRFQFIRRASPRSFGYLNGYLTGDGSAPNGEPAGSGDTFPAAPVIGDYFLRTDYLPQRMFRWDGKVWREISRNVRTRLGIHTDSTTQLSSFVNESGRTNDATGGTVPTRQSLSTALRIKPD